MRRFIRSRNAETCSMAVASTETAAAQQTRFIFLNDTLEGHLNERMMWWETPDCELRHRLPSAVCSCGILLVIRTFYTYTGRGQKQPFNISVCNRLTVIEKQKSLQLRAPEYLYYRVHMSKMALFISRDAQRAHELINNEKKNGSNANVLTL